MQVGNSDSANRLGILLGAFVHNERQDPDVKSLSPELLALRRYCVARNYVYLMRFKLLDAVPQLLEALHQICRALAPLIADLISSSAVAPKVYHEIESKLNSEIDGLVWSQLQNIEKFVGIESIHYCKLFHAEEMNFEEFITSAPLPKKALPKGLYIDSLNDRKTPYNMLLQDTNVLLKYMALFGMFKHTVGLADVLISEGCKVEAENDVGNAGNKKFRVYVDADNMLMPFALLALDAMYKQGYVESVHVYTDAKTSHLWELLNGSVGVTIHPVYRLIATKSLVDLQIVADIARDSATGEFNPMLLSSDSDYSVVCKDTELTVVYTVDRMCVRDSYLSNLAQFGSRALPLIPPKRKDILQLSDLLAEQLLRTEDLTDWLDKTGILKLDAEGYTRKILMRLAPLTERELQIIDTQWVAEKISKQLKQLTQCDQSSGCSQTPERM